MNKEKNNEALVSENSGNTQNTISPLLLNFVFFLGEMSVDFEKINKNYKIDIQDFYDKDNQCQVEFKLIYKDKSLCSYNTSLSFYKYKDVTTFELKEADNLSEISNSNLERKISFNEDTDLYKKIVEDNFVTAILNNEMEVRNTVSIRLPPSIK